MKKYTVIADILHQAYYEIEADSELEAKTIVQAEDAEPFETTQVTSPVVVDVIEEKVS